MRNPQSNINFNHLVYICLQIGTIATSVCKMERIEWLKQFQLDPEDSVSKLLTAKYMTTDFQRFLNYRLNMPPSTEYYITLQRLDGLWIRVHPKPPYKIKRRGQLRRIQLFSREYLFGEGFITTHPFTTYEIEQVISKLKKDIPQLSSYINLQG